MPSGYAAQLDALAEQMVELCRMAGTAMERATEALLQADLPLAESVIGEHDAIAEASAKAEESGLTILTLWAPVARDLRMTVNSIQIASEAERMGALAVHVAKIARRRHPQCAIPDDVRGFFSEMSRVAIEVGRGTRAVLGRCDPANVVSLRADDGVMDRLYRSLLAVMEQRDWRYGTATAIDVTLLGRCYQRFADHAAQISRRVSFRSAGAMFDSGDAFAR